MTQVEKVEQKNVGFVSKNVDNKKKREQRDQEELDALLKEFEGKEDQEEDSQEESGEEETPQDKPKDTEDATWKKRYGDLRKHSQKREAELKEEIEALKKDVAAIKESGGSADVPEDEKELEEWMSKNPDAARLINMMAERVADEKYGTLKEELESLKVGQEAVSKDKAVAKIMKAHPDFEELQEDDNFHDWVESQPKLVQDSVYESSDPESVIWAIDRYKESLKPKKTKSKDTSAAESVSGRERSAPATEEKGVFKESDVQKMDQRTFEKNFEKIEEAIKNGKFVYDISGGAR